MSTCRLKTLTDNLPLQTNSCIHVYIHLHIYMYHHVGSGPPKAGERCDTKASHNSPMHAYDVLFCAATDRAMSGYRRVIRTFPPSFWCEGGASSQGSSGFRATGYAAVLPLTKEPPPSADDFSLYEPAGVGLQNPKRFQELSMPKRNERECSPSGRIMTAASGCLCTTEPSRKSTP